MLTPVQVRFKHVNISTGQKQEVFCQKVLFLKNQNECNSIRRQELETTLYSTL